MYNTVSSSTVSAMHDTRTGLLYCRCMHHDVVVVVDAWGIEVRLLRLLF